MSSKLRIKSAIDEGATGSLAFFRRQLAEAVSRRYLKANQGEVTIHRSLALYFGHKADPSRKEEWNGDYSGAFERRIPTYHLIRMALPERLDYFLRRR